MRARLFLAAALCVAASGASAASLMDTLIARGAAIQKARAAEPACYAKLTASRPPIRGRARLTFMRACEAATP